MKRPKSDFFTVFPIFQGHVTFLRDSQGHFCILLFRDASFGTGPVRVRPWEGQNTSKSVNFGRYVFGFVGWYVLFRAPVHCNRGTPDVASGSVCRGPTASRETQQTNVHVRGPNKRKLINKLISKKNQIKQRNDKKINKHANPTVSAHVYDVHNRFGTRVRVKIDKNTRPTAVATVRRTGAGLRHDAQARVARPPTLNSPPPTSGMF